MQLTESQNELNGLRTNSWFWLPSNSQAGGLSDGTVREQGGGGTLITQRPLVAASAAVRKEKLNFIQSCLQKATPNLATQTWSFDEQRPGVSGTVHVSLQHFPGTHQEHKHARYGSVLRAHQHTEFGCT